MTQAPIQKKVCLLGEFSVGKTSLINRFVYNRFDERYLSTIGVKISRKEMNVQGDRSLNLLIWDLAGSEEFTGLQSGYLQGAAAALLVCDLTRGSTLGAVQKYGNLMRHVVASPKLLVLGNKCDLTDEREIGDHALKVVTEQLNAPYLLTSAKTGQGVEEAFVLLAESLLGA